MPMKHMRCIAHLPALWSEENDHQPKSPYWRKKTEEEGGKALDLLHDARGQLPYGTNALGFHPKIGGMPYP